MRVDLAAAASTKKHLTLATRGGIIMLPTTRWTGAALLIGETSEWHRLYEASIAIMQKQSNEIGADAWCNSPHSAILPGAVLFDEHR